MSGQLFEIRTVRAEEKNVEQVIDIYEAAAPAPVLAKGNGKNGNNARMLTLNDLACKVLRGKDRTSNPTLSATQSEPRRN